MDCIICGVKENRNVIFDFVKYDETLGPIYEWTYFCNDKSFYTEKEAVYIAEALIYENKVNNIRIMKLMPNDSWVKVDLQNSPYASQPSLS